jgi:hypothetical protein
MADESAVVPAGKPAWQSRTILVNSIAGVLIALTPFVPALAPIHAWIAGNPVLIGSIWSAINVALRFITKDKIQLGE